MKDFHQIIDSIGDGINLCVEYVENRVFTGKFVKDIEFLVKAGKLYAKKYLAKQIASASKSPSLKRLFDFMQIVTQQLSKIPLIKGSISLVLDTLWLLVKYYADFFIVFAIIFPSAILLLNFFETSTSIFFIAFLPILLFNMYCLSALYYCIDRNSKGEKISIWKSFGVITQQIGSLGYLVLAQGAIILESIIGFSIIAFFLSYFFELLNIAWTSSFLFWFIVIVLGLSVMIGIFGLVITLHQAFFIILLEKKSFRDACKSAWNLVYTYPLQFLFLYLLLYLLSGYILYWATLYYLYVGLALTVFFATNLSLFFGFLLRRRLYKKVEGNEVSNTKSTPIITVILLFGIINYFLIGTLVAKQYQNFTTLLQNQRDNFFLSQKQAIYTNTLYDYTLQFPQDWTVYEWSPGSVTFYNNYNGTISGGVWFNVSVSPYTESTFKRIYDIRPGLVSYETGTKDITIKVTNIAFQGYDGVKYTTAKTGESGPEYQTHYLIHKDGLQYDLTFTTLNKNEEDTNSHLFERIVASFRFTD